MSSLRRSYITLVFAVCIFTIAFITLFRYRVMLELSDGYGQDCKPRTSVAFSKNHKAASSTIQSILLRYAMKRDLNFVFPWTGNVLGVGFPFAKSIIANTPWAKANISYDMFGIHAVWNQKGISEIMKPDTLYITIVRDPVDLFVSAWDYFEMESVLKMPLDRFININDSQKTLMMAKSPYKHLGHNQMLRDLGLPSYALNNTQAILRKIAEVDENFQLVMIAEHFDESLILLKELLCWSFEDITYLKLNSRNSESKRKLFQYTSKEEVRSKLSDWLRGDFMLYNYFYDKFYKDYVPKIMNQRDMIPEVRYLRAMNTELEGNCVLKTYKESHDIQDPKFQLWKNNLVGYEMSPGCEYYGMKENDFIDIVRDAQTRRMKDMYDVEASVETSAHVQQIKDINQKIQEMRRKGPLLKSRP